MPNTSKGQNPKTSASGVRKSLLMEKVPAEKMGDLMVPQNHLTHWTGLRVLNGLGGTGMWWWGKF